MTGTWHNTPFTSAAVCMKLSLQQKQKTFGREWGLSDAFDVLMAASPTSPSISPINLSSWSL